MISSSLARRWERSTAVSQQGLHHSNACCHEGFPVSEIVNFWVGGEGCPERYVFAVVKLVDANYYYGREGRTVMSDAQKTIGAKKTCISCQLHPQVVKLLYNYCTAQFNWQLPTAWWKKWESVYTGCKIFSICLNSLWASNSTFHQCCSPRLHISHGRRHTWWTIARKKCTTFAWTRKPSHAAQTLQMHNNAQYGQRILTVKWQNIDSAFCNL